uniref:Uncharacterized protein n=1 Tax=Amphimedon queenslandica TaxID=400682 RepID=A0A1X7SS64_AMPQE
AICTLSSLVLDKLPNRVIKLPVNANKSVMEEKIEQNALYDSWKECFLFRNNLTNRNR